MKALATPSAPGLWQVVAALAAFLLLQHAQALVAPFFSDDYLFLDKVAGAPLSVVWSPEGLAYHWYRPWSRELHYWVFHRLFALDTVPYHVASFALWLTTAALYWALVRRVAGAAVATLACCGVAALAAWGVLLEWAPGVQDLWMMALSLACLHAFAARRPSWAAAALALALLSKETAAVVPAIALAWSLAVDRERVPAALRRVAPLLALVVVWAAIHPTLGGRWWWTPEAPPLPTVRTHPASAALRSLLALVNLDLAPRPMLGWARALFVALPGAVVLALLAAMALRRSSGASAGAEAGAHPASGEPGSARIAMTSRPEPSAAARPAALLWLSAAWTLAAFLPLLMPSVLWQSYYALFGALGAWIAIAWLLSRSRGVAIAAIVAIALLRGARSDTATRDWGNEWTMRFGKTFMGQSQAYFRRAFPTLPGHSRLYFTGVPRGVVFVVGRDDTPALRVWFRDRTVKGSFWTDYRLRARDAAPGPDYFFRWDSTAGWTQVIRGAENADSMRALDPHWRENHERLAWVLLEGGDRDAAAAEYAKLAIEEPAFDHAYLAALAHQAIGDVEGAARWYAAAESLPGGDPKAVAAVKAFNASR